MHTIFIIRKMGWSIMTFSLRWQSKASGASRLQNFWSSIKTDMDKFCKLTNYFQILLGSVRGQKKSFTSRNSVICTVKFTTVHLYICKRERSRKMVHIQTADHYIQQENVSQLKIYSWISILMVYHRREY